MSALDNAFSEVYANEPKAVTRTRRKSGDARAEKQRVAIALSKARKPNPMRHFGESMCHFHPGKGEG